ncbi:MAG: HugZ family protein [Flavobacteriaceae bacterium]
MKTADEAEGASGGGEFDAVATARELLRTTAVASLATLDESGTPYCSLIEIAGDGDGAPLTLISRLALHTRYAERDPRAAILMDRRVGKGPPLTRARISLSGRLVRLDDERRAARFLAHHPDAAGYAGFADFAFWRLEVAACHLVAGFGRIVDIAPDDLLIGIDGAEALLEAEGDVVAHMNADHRDAMALYARFYGGAEEGEWLCAGVDPRGMTLRCGERLLHVAFPRRVSSPGVLRKVLHDMAAAARAAL